MFFNQDSNTIPNTIIDFLQSQGFIDNRVFSRVDIIENNNEIIAYIDVPGIRESSIYIDFFNNRIDIKGTRICPYDNETQVCLNEIKYGSLERSITIPISVTNRDSVSLSCENGVLTIRVNKEMESQNRFNMRIQPNNEEND